MSSSLLDQQDQRKWRALYRAAISAADTSVMRKRVAAAEETICARAAELKQTPGWAAQDEKQALDDALYVLNALRKSADHAA